MPTERLHLLDSLVLRFDGRVLRRAEHHGAPSLILDRTAFYAEGGGQLGDRGTLRRHDGAGDESSIEIRDVQIDDAGEVHHLLAAEAPAGVIGAEVTGAIDEARRRDFMSQHTGQHMLSRALLDVAGGETVSSRLGAETSTIDLGLPALDDALAARAEDRVNAVVLEDRPVRVHFPTAEELAAMPLRRQPKVTADIRVIEVEGFDWSPCGGTHCARTGQVGPVRILKTERYKGMTRVTFVAGARTIADHREKDAALRELGRAFKCGPLDVLGAVGRMRGDLRDAQQALGAARAQLMQLAAEQLLAANPARPDGTTPIVAVREGEGVDALRALAGALARRPDVLAVAASKDPATGDFLVVIERGARAQADAGAWLKAQVARFGGRGGGRAEHAEGRLAAAIDWSAV